MSTSAFSRSTRSNMMKNIFSSRSIEEDRSPLWGLMFDVGHVARFLELRLPDQQHTPCEVNIGQRQPQGFADPQACCVEQSKQGGDNNRPLTSVRPYAPGGGHDLPRFLALVEIRNGPVAPDWRNQTRKIHVRVLADGAVAKKSPQGTVQRNKVLRAVFKMPIQVALDHFRP